MFKKTREGAKSLCKLLTGAAATAGLLSTLSAANASIPEEPVHQGETAARLETIRQSVTDFIGTERAAEQEGSSVISQWLNSWSNWNNWSNWYKPWHNFSNYSWGNW
ncbi:hypothetical protein PhaeoP18_03492 (plasmid) [Phaeobacter piscinae]|nr:hypothetical protein PhaeoP18_03492 [Phaeobacter piscinae]